MTFVNYFSYLKKTIFQTRTRKLENISFAILSLSRNYGKEIDFAPLLRFKLFHLSPQPIIFLFLLGMQKAYARPINHDCRIETLWHRPVDFSPKNENLIPFRISYNECQYDKFHILFSHTKKEESWEM